MRKTTIIFFLLVLAQAGAAQRFQTRVKKGPVVIGEPFRVQYVLEETQDQEFYAPEFKNFRFINGPEIHEGESHTPVGSLKLKNYLYTLEPLQPGKWMIPLASARIRGRLITSDKAWVEVITKAEAIKRGMLAAPAEKDGGYFLAPGEDPYARIRENLFLKINLDKKACFVGEPITATFTLYSRLMSRSDIVKNPGFYGFTVQDMVGLDDRQAATEVINGKRFDVHTIRKVQLYPLQAGLFTIDPMEVTNKVEFSRSVVNKRTEQEIAEGVYEEARRKTPDTEEYESSMSTPAISVVVKPTPAKNRPDGFAGATGHFLIKATVVNVNLVQQEGGELVVTISGEGNFTQLVAPVVHWPAGIEGFEPQISDTLDRSHSPLKGDRIFRFPFLSSRTGQYTIPAVSFSFFDPDSNGYKTISSRDITVRVVERAGVATARPVQTKDPVKDNRVIVWLVCLFVFACIGAWLLYAYRKRKPAPAEEVKEESQPTITALLQPAASAIDDDQLYYTALRTGIWQFLTARLGLSGSQMNGRDLLTVLQARRVNEQYARELTETLQRCETGIFAGAYSTSDKKELLEKAVRVLEGIDNDLQ